MANQNFVVHNGLTVGALTIDAATSNVALPVGKQITIGNVILRDDGDGKLHIRDITDNSDAVLVGTVDAPSVTQGNIQIGTNHIESINVNGPISLRPNGTGVLVFASNVISAGKGATELTIATGLAMPAEYGVTYANANIILSPGRIGLYSGNVWVNQTTAATNSITGAFRVTGGVGIGGAIHSGPVSPITYSNPVYSGVGNANAFVQLNVQNINSVGTNVSSDIIATAPNGTDSANFIDMGINGNLFTSPGSAWTVSGALDGYLYVNGGHLTIGTDTATKDIIFHTGSTTNGDIVARFYDITGNLTVFGPQYIAPGGYLNVSGNVLAQAGTFNALTVNNGNIGVTTGWINAGTVNVLGNILASVAEFGAVESSGVIYANSTAASTSTTTGALIVAGGISSGQNSFFGANVTIQGNLFVNGNVTTFNTNNLSINDSLIYLADDNPADIIDIGFVSSFTSGAGYQHTGFARDASDGLWKLFAGVVAEPTTTIDFTGATYSSLYVGNIQTVNSANIGSTLNVAGNILAKTATLGATTVNGATTLAGTVTVSSGFINSVGNILSTGATHNSLTVNGATTQAGTLTVSSGFINSAGNVVATGGVFNALTVNGATTHAGTTALQGTSTTQIVQPDGDNTRTLGASGVRWSTVYGVTFSGTSTTANYADLAEKYQADAEYAPGTVLQFGGDREVTLAEEGTRKVAGVVSTNPAHLMNDQLQGENTVALALTGRVPVKVKGRIQKGDMMVSAGDGYARASAMPQIGTVIGKSLEDFDGSDGVIEVVVGRL